MEVKVINKHKIIGCEKKVIKLVDWLNEYAERVNTELIITSGKRDGRGRSWHNTGRAVDFYFKESNVFKHVTPIYMACFQQVEPFDGVTELEVCRRNRDNKQHFHVAFGEEGRLETFTGVYK